MANASYNGRATHYCAFMTVSLAVFVGRYFGVEASLATLVGLLYVLIVFRIPTKLDAIMKPKK
jgi:hypothetical protein